ncbi:hypothetical protein LTR78_007179 [Recurvomyces mirabilis]|uniref:Heterokaryon incompatibility domain-containing protein n=1 Tax=Recurvomyces mirabilis TaxID=574656 RepID=A0AAE1BZ03_9PEZI|nr:hypothetical protein LTR78_007179 [Recurvomyces mirabilis]KAK5150849.1 hypothetical protein LTS14_009652 [Recurvomyces mirabilis]
MAPSTLAAEAADGFVHQPLEHPATSIRLCKLEPAEHRDSDIECTIFTTPLDGAPPYVAVSYTWGDARVQRTIQINGKALSVGYNSWEVLWQLRLHSEHGALFWMDMLCIDQTNDAEKSIQVGLMGAIYRNATFVFAGVGAHGEDSEFLAEQIHLYIAYIGQRRKESAAAEPRILTQPCNVCGPMPPSTSLMVYCDSCDLVSCKEHWDDVFRLHKEESGHGQVVETDYTNPGASPVHCDRCRQPGGKQWYEHVGGTGQLCPKCYHDNLPPAADHHQTYQQRDRWGFTQGDVKWYYNLRHGLETWLWFTELRASAHQRINTALKAFSLRTYFTRLWVVQEVALSRYVIMACGDEIFPVAEFDALYRDSNEAVECGLGRNFLVPGYAAGGIEAGHPAQSPSSGIAELVFTFAEWQCFDARDRLFALLAMADQSSISGITPDYIKSAVSVVMQLLRQICIDGVYFDIPNEETIMEELFAIVASFRLEFSQHEISALLTARVCHRQSCRVPYSQPVLGAKPSDRTQVRISARVRTFFPVQEDENGKLWAPLHRTKEEIDPAQWTLAVRTAFRQACQRAEDSFCGIHSRGEILAIATGSVKSGDIVLSFGNNKNNFGNHFSGLHTPCAGLVVRQTTSERYLIVGQIIFDLEVEPLPDALLSDAERGRVTGPSYAPDVVWEVHFDPEDLMLFIVQDLVYYQAPRAHDRPTMLDCTVRPEYTVKRLETSVTSDTFSSYATRSRQPAALPVE